MLTEKTSIHTFSCRRILTAVLLLLVNFSATTQADTTLILSYWTDATPPFAWSKNGQLTAGLIKDIGDELARQGGYKVAYREVPVKRIEAQLAEGSIHVDCITNPIWKEKPELLSWSPVLFQGADRFLVQKGSEHEITSLDDLRGKVIGTYNGYVYHPSIMEMFSTKAALAEQVQGIDKGVRLVSMGRLDALIDFDILLLYQIRQGQPNDNLTLASFHADDYDLQCAYSPHSPVATEEIDDRLNAMIKTGFISKALDKYR
jgi:ABC-type amino acid transport substrate-binding protein